MRSFKLIMKKIIPALLFFILLPTLGADEMMANLQDASSQVSADIVRLTGEDVVYFGQVSFEGRPVVLGDLMSDLVANRLLDNSRFRGNVVKGYTGSPIRLTEVDWTVSGSLYKTGSSYFLSLYLNDNSGLQKKGWEFLLPADSVEALLEPSRMAAFMGSDMYEPNDSSSTAFLLEPSPFVELEDLELGESGDEDWFCIDVDQLTDNSLMSILSLNTTGNLDTYLELYAPSDTSYPVVENDDGSNSSNASITYPLTETGRWYFKVRGYSSDETGDYGLSVRLETREPGPGEPDDSMDQASVLEIEGDEIRRSMDYGEDYDYFAITLNRDLPDDKALVVETSSGMDLTMTFLDEYESEVMTDDDSGMDSNPKLVLPGLAAGTWYAVVYPYDSDNTGSYTIRAYLKDVVRDEYENDNTMEEASEIEISGYEQVRTFMPADEEDWVRFEVRQSGEYMMKTTGPIDTYLTLYSESGDYLMDDDDSGYDGNAQIEIRLEPGTYYLQVTQYEGGGNSEDSYSLIVTPNEG